MMGDATEMRGGRKYNDRDNWQATVLTATEPR